MSGRGFNFILFLVSVGFLVQSCKPAKTTVNYDSGTPKEVFEISKDGTKNGEYVAYFENGRIQEKSIYLDGLLVGLRTIYDDKGNLEITENYNETGKLEGKYTVYYPSGEVKLEKVFNNDLVNGVIKVYYPSGQVKEEVTIVDNIENGAFTEYHVNGNIQWRGQYLNGDHEFGLLEEFDSLGVIIRKMNCDSLAACRTFWKSETAK